MDESTSLTTLHINLGKRKRVAPMSQIADSAHYLYRCSGGSYEEVAKMTGKSESTIRLWVKLFEALSSDPRLKRYADSGQISAVSLYRIVSHFDRRIDRLNAVISLQHFDDKEVRLILNCLKNNAEMTIEKCTQIVANNVFHTRSNRITVMFSDIEYRKLARVASRRKMSVPLLVSGIVDENLGALLQIKRADLIRKNHSWSITFPLSMDLRRALDKHALLVGRNPIDIIEGILRQNL